MFLKVKKKKKIRKIFNTLCIKAHNIHFNYFLTQKKIIKFYEIVRKSYKKVIKYKKSM